jgi:DNA-binding LytR/AlgR family response regulator
MTCYIADDEHLARKLLEAYAARIPGLEVLGSFENAMQVLAALREQPADLLLLDIQMPDLTGLELLRTLRQPPVAILVTAYADHALQGYELDVADYLLKPVSFERFVQAIGRAEERAGARAPAAPAADFQAGPGYFFVRADYKLIRVDFGDILYIEGLREYVSIYTRQKRHVVYQSMKHLEDWLPQRQFARIHKSYIVALDKIGTVYGNVVEIGGQELPVGKSYRDGFLSKLQTL